MEDTLEIKVFRHNGSTDLHEIWNLSSFDNNGHIHKFSWRSVLTKAHKRHKHALASFTVCALVPLVRVCGHRSLLSFLKGQLLPNELKFTISWRSDLPLRRYLQNNIDFLNTLIFNVFSIFSLFHSLFPFGHSSVKFCLNSMILDIFQQPRRWAIQKCPRF